MISLSHKDGFVFYQKPGSNDILFLKGTWKKIDLNKKTALDGFIISNFNNSETYYLKGNSTKVSASYKLQLINKTPLTTELSKNDYLTKAQQFQVACRSNLKKVILSRTKQQIRAINKDLYKTYRKLCQTYNHSFNYLLNIPNIGTWMGATPEILLTKENNIFTTVSLAGSQPVDNTNWKEKELKEQQIVTDYILEKLQPITSQLNFNKNPETVLAGNIAHLKTTFNFKSEKTSLEITSLLHPTPAVCGLPRQKAQVFIAKNEGYNREFYTGFLGEIKADSCNLFVNLRCMKVFSNSLLLYVGGGITANSIPEKEWEETELKAQTLLEILE